ARNGMPASAAMASHVPPRSTRARINTGSAPASRTTSAASSREVPRVTVSSVITTRSPGSSAPATRPPPPWPFTSLRTLNALSERPRVAATAAVTKAIGSAPMVSPPMAVAAAGMTSRATSATRSIPSGRQAVCLESTNQLLRRPDLRTNSPRRTEWASRCSRRAAKSPIGLEVHGAGPLRHLPDLDRVVAALPEHVLSPEGVCLRHDDDHPDAEVEDPGHLVVGDLTQPLDLG